MITKKIAITTGDEDGVGLELTIKALKKIGPKKNTCFVLYRHKKSQVPRSQKLIPGFRVLQVPKFDPFCFSDPKFNFDLIDVCGATPPATWVEDSARLCLSGSLSGLVTGPLSKTSIRNSGLSDMGHTGILKRISGVKNIFMGFRGKHFNVVLLTDHIDINLITQGVTTEALELGLGACQDFANTLGGSLATRPIALMGINPHCGDHGLISDSDQVIFKFIEKKNSALTKRNQLVGPLSPDSAFLPENWKRFSCYLANYHDQGLIPFKMAHGFSGGAQISLGLPFVRTSVDHGPAKELFGKGLANPGSMEYAINLCLTRISRQKGIENVHKDL